ncbi:hypothetical protein D3C76_1401830 [compost metagenome]
MLLELFDVRVHRNNLTATGKVIIPIGSPLWLVYKFPGNHRYRSSDWKVLSLGTVNEVIVIVGPRLIEIIYSRHIRIIKNVRQLRNRSSST